MRTWCKENILQVIALTIGAISIMAALLVGDEIKPIFHPTPEEEEYIDWS